MATNPFDPSAPPLSPSLQPGGMPTFQGPPPTPPSEPQHFMRAALPFLGAVLAGRKDPQIVAAAISGWIEGKRRKELRVLGEAEAARRHRLETMKFYNDAIGELAGTDDEYEFELRKRSLGQIARAMGTHLDDVQFSPTKRSAKQRKEMLDAYNRNREIHGDEVMATDAFNIQLPDGRLLKPSILAQMLTGAQRDDGSAPPPKGAPKTETPKTIGSSRILSDVPLDRQHAAALQAGDTALAKQIEQAMTAQDATRRDPPRPTDPAIADLRKQLLQGQVDAATTKAADAKTTADRAKAAARKTSGDTLDVLKQLIDVAPDGRVTLKPGVGNLFGMRFPGARYVPGTTTADAAAALERLKGRVVVDLLAEMKSQSRTGATGFGALTERELDLLQNAATQLNSANISDTRAAEELARIYDIASRAYSAAPTAAPSSGTTGGGNRDPLGIRSSGGATRDPLGIRR